MTEKEAKIMTPEGIDAPLTGVEDFSDAGDFCGPLLGLFSDAAGNYCADSIGGCAMVGHRAGPPWRNATLLMMGDFLGPVGSQLDRVEKRMTPPSLGEGRRRWLDSVMERAFRSFQPGCR